MLSSITKPSVVPAGGDGSGEGSGDGAGEGSGEGVGAGCGEDPPWRLGELPWIVTGAPWPTGRSPPGPTLEGPGDAGLPLLRLLLMRSTSPPTLRTVTWAML